jgi:hypothetical protein
METTRSRPTDGGKRSSYEYSIIALQFQGTLQRTYDDITLVISSDIWCIQHIRAARWRLPEFSSY